MIINSGTGNGYSASVNAENRLDTVAVIIPRQHLAAKGFQKAFQLVGEATAASGTVNVLHLRNQTADQAFTVNYVRAAAVDLAGGTAVPNASNYFTLEGGESYASGGTVKASANTYVGSSVTDASTHYEGNPTLSGSSTVYDKFWPTGDADEQSYSKEGSLIVPPGEALTIKFTGDNTSGSLYARVSYYVADVGDLDS